MVKSTATVVPYPTGPASSGSSFGTGTGLPSVSLVIQKQTSSAQGVASTPSHVPTTASPIPTQFKGAASNVNARVGMSGLVAVVIGIVGFVM